MNLRLCIRNSQKERNVSVRTSKAGWAARGAAVLLAGGWLLCFIYDGNSDAAPEVKSAASGSNGAPAEDSGAGTQSVDAPQLSLDVSYGYDNTAKGGRYLPVDAALSNSGTEAFSGMLQAKVMESRRYGIPV